MQQKSDTSRIGSGFAETFQWFENLEREHDLVSLEIAGVRIWQLLRGRMFDRILFAGDLALDRESRFTTIAERIAGRMRAIWREPSSLMPSRGLVSVGRGLSAALFAPWVAWQSRRLLASPPSAEVVVARFNRLMNDRYDLTAPVSDNACLFLTKPKFAYPLTQMNICIKDIERAARSRPRTVLESFDREKIIGLAALLEDSFGFSKDELQRQITLEIDRFVRSEAVLGELLERCGTREIYLCWNSLYYPLVSAARNRSIRTIEFQHGTITLYHCHYCYRHGVDMPYLPDEIRFFGQAWIDQSPLPPGVKAINAGAPHLRRLLDDYSAVPKQEDLVLVVSQTVVGLHLYRFTVEVARLRPDLNFVFKLHPAERYQDLAGYVPDPPSNIRIVSGKGDTYRLMASAAYQMGVSSTTLEEGFAFGNRTVVVPLPSYEYLEPEIERGHATLARTPQEAASLLSEVTPLCDDVGLYFSNLGG